MFLLIGLADATDENAYNAQGLAAHDISNNSYGYMIIAVQSTDSDTSGLSAQQFFVGLSAGAVQNASVAIIQILNVSQGGLLNLTLQRALSL